MCKKAKKEEIVNDFYNVDAKLYAVVVCETKLCNVYTKENLDEKWNDILCSMIDHGFDVRQDKELYRHCKQHLSEMGNYKKAMMLFLSLSTNNATIQIAHNNKVMSNLIKM